MPPVGQRVKRLVRAGSQKGEKPLKGESDLNTIGEYYCALDFSITLLVLSHYFVHHCLLAVCFSNALET